MKRSAWRIAVALVLFASPRAEAIDWRDPLAAANQSGNVSLRAGDPGAALEAYKSAQVESPESPQLHYNIGLALAAQDKFEEAIQSFDSVYSSDEALKAGAQYNKGFCQYRMAMQAEESGDYQAALDQLQAAMDSNRDALRLTPQDEDAKFNFEQAKRAWKELYDKIKQEQENPQQDQDQQQQDGEENQDQQGDGQQQDQQQQGEGDQEQQEGQDQDPSAQPSPAPEGGQQEQENQGEGDQENQQQQVQAEGLTEEQARRILNSLGEENAEAFKNLFRPQGMPIKRWKNDW